MGKRRTIGIYKSGLAGFLMLKGFVCYGMDDNYNEGEEGRKVYFFNSSKELEDSIKIFSKHKKSLKQYACDLKNI